MAKLFWRKQRPRSSEEGAEEQAGDDAYEVTHSLHGGRDDLPPSPADEAAEVATSPESESVAAESPDLRTSSKVQSPPPEWLERRPNDGEAEPVTIGSASTFGSADWWTTDWWPLESTTGDIIADFATIGGFAIAGVALRGNKHRLGGEPCEDSFHLRRATMTSGEEVACIAVCDGVGSARKSRLGARWLARATTARLTAAVARTDSIPLGENAARVAIEEAVADVRELAVRRNIDLGDLRTTLTFAVVVSSGGVGAHVVCGQVGDSPIFIGSDEGLRPALDPDKGGDSYITTATDDALSARPEALRVVELRLAPGDLLLACSDGVGNFLWSRSGVLELGRHLARSLRSPVPQLEFIRQVGFDLRSADDDRTTVVLWTKPLAVESAT